MPVSFRDILDAFEFVSAGGLGEHQAYLCRQTGKIYWHSDFLDSPDDDSQDKLPADIDDGEAYVEIPDRRELDLGKPLVLDFTLRFLPDDYDEVRRIFSKRGAYSAFKFLLGQRNALDKWYAFETEASERALRQWCDLNSIEISG
jgi:hypothetical protein